MTWTFDPVTGDYSLPHCVLRQAGSKAVTLTTRGYTVPLTPDQLADAASIARRWVETGEWEPASTPDSSGAFGADGGPSLLDAIEMFPEHPPTVLVMGDDGVFDVADANDLENES